MRSSLALIALFTSSLAFAQTETLTDAKTRFCQERLSSSDSVQMLISQKANQLSMVNEGGLFNAGVCWWHSRFTRSAAYLAIFDPSLPRPSQDEAKSIISHLRKRAGVITVPGFRNLMEFSAYYQNEIQDKLEDWQKTDGVLKVSWIQGLKGDHDVNPEKLERKMNALYERVSQGEVVYQVLQMPGITAHSWLVVGMTQKNSGYEIKVLDSNFGNIETYIYIPGMTEFSYYGGTKFVPYTGQEKEERKLREKLMKECNQTVSPLMAIK